ncbi:MAG: hypothetical protein FJX19_12785, partial [Alphaproteobacteria bacterium]|nr:hypothetical protein [Alphaproteobacteria bacterium]
MVRRPPGRRQLDNHAPARFAVAAGHGSHARLARGALGDTARRARDRRIEAWIAARRVGLDRGEQGRHRAARDDLRVLAQPARDEVGLARRDLRGARGETRPVDRPRPAGRCGTARLAHRDHAALDLPPRRCRPALQVEAALETREGRGEGPLARLLDTRCGTQRRVEIHQTALDSRRPTGIR